MLQNESCINLRWKTLFKIGRVNISFKVRQETNDARFEVIKWGLKLYQIRILGQKVLQKLVLGSVTESIKLTRIRCTKYNFCLKSSAVENYWFWSDIFVQN